MSDVNEFLDIYKGGETIRRFQNMNMDRDLVKMDILEIPTNK